MEQIKTDWVSTKKCPHCKSEINVEATKCPHCRTNLLSFAKRPLGCGTTSLIIFGIIFMIIIAGVVSSTSNNNQSASDSNTAVSATNPPVNVCSSFQTSQAKKISFADINKDPDSFNGTDAEFTGQIVQILESNGQGVIRLAVTKTDYGWSLSDIIYVTYTGHNDFVENDIVTVYGVLQGSYTYTSQANYQITLPSMVACSVEKPTVQKVSQTFVSTGTEKNNTPTSTILTTTPPPALVIPKSWHTVVTYSNNVNTQTPPFAMQGSEWRVSYNCTSTDSSNDFSNFSGFIYNASDGSVANLFANTETCPTSNTSYVYAQPPGQYYLSLENDNSNYTVTVEDYY